MSFEAGGENQATPRLQGCSASTWLHPNLNTSVRFLGQAYLCLPLLQSDAVWSLLLVSFPLTPMESCLLWSDQSTSTEYNRL